VKVDDTLRTTNPRIYAAGDILHGSQVHARRRRRGAHRHQNALFMGRKKLSALTMPWCTYTDPEIAHVGMYEGGREKGGD